MASSATCRFLFLPYKEVLAYKHGPYEMHMPIRDSAQQRTVVRAGLHLASVLMPRAFIGLHWRALPLRIHRHAAPAQLRPDIFAVSCSVNIFMCAGSAPMLRQSHRPRVARRPERPACPSAPEHRQKPVKPGITPRLVFAA
jgi:hypothetical protein